MLLFSLLFRILSGEPYQKATPAQLRWYSAAFAFLLVFVLASVKFGKTYLDHAGMVGIWFFMMGCLLVAALLLAAWVKLVPATVSWIVGAVVWALTLWLALANKLI